MRINITGIPKEKIVIALFNNVYKKSLESSQTYMNIADKTWVGSLTPIGTDRAPTEREIADILADGGGFVDYIGAVSFKIDFSADEIDVTTYDCTHGTGTDSIKTAEDCVAIVKAEYDALVAAEARAVASLELVTRALMESFGVELLTVYCSIYSADTDVSVGRHIPRIEFSIPGKMLAIAEILSGPERMAYLDKAKAQYEGLASEEARRTASLELVTRALKESFGVENLTVYCSIYSSDTKVSVGALYHGVEFSLPGKVSVIADILSSPERIAYLYKTKAQYDELVAEKARAAASLELVTRSLKESFGVEHLKVSCFAHSSDTKISIGASYPTFDFFLPGQVSAIADILASPERTAYMDKVKERLVTEKGQEVSVSSSGFSFFPNKRAENLIIPGIASSYTKS